MHRAVESALCSAVIGCVHFAVTRGTVIAFRQGPLETVATHLEAETQLSDYGDWPPENGPTRAPE